MFLNSLQMVDLCKKNKNLNDEYGYEMTHSLPDLILKINDTEIKSKEDQLFSTNMINSIDKKTGMIDPSIYYKILGNDKFVAAFGLLGMFVIILFTDEFDLIGGATIGVAVDNTTTTVSDLFVVKKYRKNGYGKLLVKLIIKKLKQYRRFKKIVLEVDPDNRVAYRLYKKMGFFEIVNFTSKKVRMEMALEAF
jgi:ribosomal protein S18 acetylase RimI-like enzyme